MPVPIILRNNLIIPADLVEDLIVQSGLSRDQLRWGYDLALHWEMYSAAELQRWIDRRALLVLSDVLIIVGAGDVETETDYLEYLTED
jgi:hypothetical protein